MDPLHDPTEDPVEPAFAALWHLAVGSDGLRAELDESRSEFFGPVAPPLDVSSDGARLASRRHAEWFLLERPSDVVDGVPVEVFGERLRHEVEDPSGVDTLLDSRVGMFAVGEDDEGLHALDLLGAGRYDLWDPRGALASGDLLVGRVFRAPGGADAPWRASPAAVGFRNPDLRMAVQRDAEAMRSSRRGSLRISQLDLERMFHSADSVQEGGVAAAVEEARRFLLDGGLGADEAEDLFDELRAERPDRDRLASGSSDALGRVLDRLAFETEIDIDEARRVLLGAWEALGSAENTQPPRTAPGAPALPVNGGDRATVGDALSAFDEGRVAGQDLETLFRDLEGRLGLGQDSEEDEAATTPDFPGVVGAMVEEFIWDVCRERGEGAGRTFGSLRDFAASMGAIGVFENLGVRDLLDWCARGLVEGEARLGAEDATERLAALRAFCRWCEEQHQVELWSGFETLHASLRGSLPRICEANRALDVRAPSCEDLYELAEIEAGGAVLSDASGEHVRATIDADVQRWLRPGDLLRGALLESGHLAVHRCYPPEARGVLG